MLKNILGRTAVILLDIFANAWISFATKCLQCLKHTYKEKSASQHYIIIPVEVKRNFLIAHKQFSLRINF